MLGRWCVLEGSVIRWLGTHCSLPSTLPTPEAEGGMLPGDNSQARRRPRVRRLQGLHDSSSQQLLC